MLGVYIDSVSAVKVVLVLHKLSCYNNNSKYSLLTTPLEDLVFNSSLTIPNPEIAKTLVSYLYHNK